MKAIESVVYKCDYCPSRFLIQSECFDHENSCQFKPVVYPKFEFVKSKKSDFDNLCLQVGTNSIRNWIPFRIRRPAGTTSFPKDVMISLNGKNKNLWLDKENKHNFEDYFIINNNWSKECHQYDERNVLTKKMFTIDNEFNEDCITLTEFYFGKFKLEIEYADGTKIIYSDFDRKSGSNTYLEIPLYSDNDIVAIRLIEKSIKPKKLLYECFNNTCFTQCPHYENMKIGSSSCRNCKHNVGEEKMKVFCNYEEDMKL